MVCQAMVGIFLGWWGWAVIATEESGFDNSVIVCLEFFSIENVCLDESWHT